MLILFVRVIKIEVKDQYQYKEKGPEIQDQSSVINTVAKYIQPFSDNFEIQLGGSTTKKLAHFYWGISNGIAFNLPFLNTGKFTVRILDIHINLLRAIVTGCLFYTPGNLAEDFPGIALTALIRNSIMNIHLLSFSLYNCITIDLLSILNIIFIILDRYNRSKEKGTEKNEKDNIITESSKEELPSGANLSWYMMGDVIDVNTPTSDPNILKITEKNDGFPGFISDYCCGLTNRIYLAIYPRVQINVIELVRKLFTK